VDLGSFYRKEISYVKIQSSNQIQSSNVKNLFSIWPFDIDLTFACLREAASAKAGILNLEFCFFHGNAMRYALCAMRSFEGYHGLPLFSWMYSLYQGEEFRPDGTGLFKAPRI
jgi:hypothetical protein